MHGDKIFEPEYLALLGYHRVTVLIQQPGDFVFTHPMCPHFSVNVSGNVKESVSLAFPGWTNLGVRSRDCARK
jgi:hypothetical protein